jgi:endogenous inhibitor of DNA gyrase (YacG/DUF329 family)
MAWSDAAARPFCSVSCKLVDLGRWLDQRFTLPGPPLGAPVLAEFDSLRDDE